MRSFRDLEVYQKALQCSVMVAKKLLPFLEDKDFPLRQDMLECALNTPRLIAEAHSTRFDAEKTGLEILDDVMKSHNVMIVYLEQVRDIYSDEVDRVVVEELIRRYIWNRKKVFNLYKAWERFLEKDKG